MERILCEAGSRGGRFFFKTRCWDCSEHRGMQQKARGWDGDPGHGLSHIYNEEAVLDTLTLGFLSSELRQWIPDAGAGWFVALHCNSISKLRLVCCEHGHLTLEIEDF